ncbi:MAG TPA: bifunctional precorrin-2 dehydrogenase/sirohydrochlorin ferrochelatase [Acidimicrobiia bacterium]|nr:bifunctional precorrin-2 dehydrogenase/sirohydrochlorin ferrochelatase [Acidimicrobiia bacterium]
MTTTGVARSPRSAAGRPVPRGYPVNLVLEGRRVVMVGAGRIAARKVEGLLAAGAAVTVVAPRVGDEIRALADDGRLVLHERAFAPADLDGAWLAFAATDDAAVSAAVYAEAERRRMFVNSADDPANCSLTLMSVVRRGDLQIAIGTGGRSPALAAHLKERLGEEIGPEFAALLEVLSDMRDEIRGQGESSEAYDWRPAFDSAILDLVRAGKLDDAKERLRECLSSSSA